MLTYVSYGSSISVVRVAFAFCKYFLMVQSKISFWAVKDLNQFVTLLIFVYLMLATTYWKNKTIFAYLCTHRSASVKCMLSAHHMTYDEKSAATTIGSKRHIHTAQTIIGIFFIHNATAAYASTALVMIDVMK